MTGWCRLGTALCALAAASGLIGILGAAAPVPGDRALFTADELTKIYRRSPLGELPADPTNGVADSAPAAAIGQFLFFDRRLSANGEVACATCHQPARGFTDDGGLWQGTRPRPAKHPEFAQRRAQSLVLLGRPGGFPVVAGFAAARRPARRRAATGSISPISSPPTRRSARPISGSSGRSRRSPTPTAFRRMGAPIPTQGPRWPRPGRR